MSAAFRNFILTLTIMLAVFGYIAYKAMPDIESTLFGDDESSEEISEDASQAIVNVSEEVSDTSEEPAVENTSFSCVFATKNDDGDICSVLYAEADSETQKFTICRIPVDLYLDDNGVYKTLYRLLGDNDCTYMMKKLSPLIGKEITNYVLCTADSYKAAAGICENLGSPLTAELSYTVRYLDPVFGDIPDPPEEYFVNLSSGKNVLTSENAPYILNSKRDSSAVNYTFQESFGISVFRQLISVVDIKDSTENLSLLFKSVTTNITEKEMKTFASVLFAYSEYESNLLTYPTTYEYNRPDMKIPNWSNGIKMIKSARGE